MSDLYSGSGTIPTTYRNGPPLIPLEVVKQSIAIYIDEGEGRGAYTAALKSERGERDGRSHRGDPGGAYASGGYDPGGGGSGGGPLTDPFYFSDFQKAEDRNIKIREELKRAQESQYRKERGVNSGERTQAGEGSGRSGGVHPKPQVIITAAEVGSEEVRARRKEQEQEQKLAFAASSKGKSRQAENQSQPEYSGRTREERPEHRRPVPEIYLSTGSAIARGSAPAGPNISQVSIINRAESHPASSLGRSGVSRADATHSMVGAAGPASSSLSHVRHRGGGSSKPSQSLSSKSNLLREVP